MPLVRKGVTQPGEEKSLVELSKGGLVLNLYIEKVSSRSLKGRACRSSRDLHMGICTWSTMWYYLWNYQLIRVEVSILFESFPPNSLMIHYSHRVDGGLLYHQRQPRRAMISCILFQGSGYSISCKSIHPIEGLMHRMFGCCVFYAVLTGCFDPSIWKMIF